MSGPLCARRPAGWGKRKARKLEGGRDDAGDERPASFGLFGGYFYNVLTQARLMGARMPGATPEAIDNAYFDARDEVPPYKEESWHQSERHAAKLGETMAWVMSAEPLTELALESAATDCRRWLNDGF